MSSKRILHVCFDPAQLLSRERLLMEQGYEVYTVLGQDGLMAVRRLSDFDLVLIGNEGSLRDRHNAVRRLKEQLFPAPIVALCGEVEDLPEADYQVSTVGPSTWYDAVADCMRRC